MGSLNELDTLITNCESAYIFGLWCADGYFWSSSIGITNVDRPLVNRFARYLETMFPEERIKLRTYYPPGQKPNGIVGPAYPMRLAKQVAYQLYVNSRPLLRLFQKAERNVALLSTEYILAYFAGRFDGDGSVDKNLRNDLRIVYSNKEEAITDQNLLTKLNCYKTRVYHYKGARTYVLYVCRNDAGQFLHSIAPYSMKVQTFLPRRDSVRSLIGLDGNTHNIIP